MGAFLTSLLVAAVPVLPAAGQDAAGHPPEAVAAELRFVERQLEELYGPLGYLVEEGRLSIADFVKGLGRESVFPADGKLNEEEQKKWIFWAEQDLMPRNGTIATLIKGKAHLVEGSKVPAEFAALLEHVNSWEMNHRRWRQQGVPYAWHSQTPWPGAFNGVVATSFGRLKARHGELLKELASVGRTDAEKLAEVRHVERQLEEFYGPLQILNLEGTASFGSFMKGPGKGLTFPDKGEMAEEDRKKWLFWAETDFMPRNERRKELLRTRMHLLDGTKLPGSWLAFVDHSNSWRMNHLYWLQEQVKYSWRSRNGWPAAFDTDVAAAYEKLKKRQAELLGR